MEQPCPMARRLLRAAHRPWRALPSAHHPWKAARLPCWTRRPRQHHRVRVQWRQPGGGPPVAPQAGSQRLEGGAASHLSGCPVPPSAAGLLVKPKAAAAPALPPPPPLLELPPLPPLAAPAAAPVANGAAARPGSAAAAAVLAPAGADVASPEEVTRAIIDYLRKKPDSKGAPPPLLLTPGLWPLDSQRCCRCCCRQRAALLLGLPA